MRHKVNSNLTTIYFGGVRPYFPLPITQKFNLFQYLFKRFKILSVCREIYLDMLVLRISGVIVKNVLKLFNNIFGITCALFAEIFKLRTGWWSNSLNFELLFKGAMLLIPYWTLYWTFQFLELKTTKLLKAY